MTSEQEKLFFSGVRIAYYLSNKYYKYFTFLERADVDQTGMVGLSQAVLSYNEDMGEFSTHAFTCIKNLYIKNIGHYYYRDENKVSVSKAVMNISLDATIKGEDEISNLHDLVASPSSINETSNVINKVSIEWAKDIVSEVIKETPRNNETSYKINMKVFNDYYTKGKSQTQIAKELGITKGAVNQRLRRMESGIRDKIGDNHG